MSDEMTIENKHYISSKRAAELSGYTQDYVGQLARKGLLEARRIGGLWYIERESLEAYTAKADTYKPEPPHYNNRHTDLASFVGLDGKDYISATRASEISGYHKDYVGQLARSGQILGRQVGNRWYVEKQSLLDHKREKDALLAEVQKQSVGLVSQKNLPHDDIHKWREDEGIMTYFPEQSDLTPHLEQKNHKSTHSSHILDISPSAQHTTLHAQISKPSTHHVSREQYSINNRKKYPPHKVKRTIIAGTIGTIIIIISLGFISLKSYSLYTINTLTHASAPAAAAAPLHAIGDLLERLLTTELVYQQSQN